MDGVAGAFNAGDHLTPGIKFGGMSLEIQFAYQKVTQALGLKHQRYLVDRINRRSEDNGLAVDIAE